MKLYHYDHCPYCVRVRLMIGLKNLHVEEIGLPNDDEATPISLIGKKVVPILIKEDGTPMDESLDIVRYLDENYGFHKILADGIRHEVQKWCDEVGSFYYRLTHPRCIQLGLPEFQTQSAIDYFVKKKSEKIGSFEENFANSEQYIAQLQPYFEQLVELMDNEKSMQKTLSYEDIIVFPMLRNLTCVKGLNFPPKIKNYLLNMAKRSGVSLAFNQQI